MSAVCEIDFSEAEVLRSICKQSFFEFVQHFWHTVIDEPPIWNWHIEVLCEEMQIVAERVFKNEPKLYDLVINVPPGSTKSTICSIMFPAWAWTRKPASRFICGSFSADLSIDLSLKCRDVIMSEAYQELFPEIRLRDDQKAKGYYYNTRKGMRISTSATGVIVGRHAHFLITDDPIDPNAALSEQRMKEVNRWMVETLPQRKVSSEISVQILIQQRLHQDDPSGQAIEMSDKKPIRHICLPAELSEDVRPKNLAINYHKGLLDPNRLSQKVLEEKKLLGQYVYSAQYQQRATPPAGGMFKVARFQIDIPHLPIVKSVRYWDKACLIAGTQITTKRGKVPIEKVVAGDFVLTRTGFCKVLKAWLSKYTNELTTVIFSNGESVTGTPDHLVFTKNAGWKCLENLTYSDRVVVENDFAGGRGLKPCANSDGTAPSFLKKFGDLTRRLKWKLRHSKDCVTANIAGISTVTNGTKKTNDTSACLCTEKSGKAKTETFPKATISTTKTEIGVTTTFQILKASPQKSIARFIWLEVLRMRFLFQIRSMEKKHVFLLKNEYQSQSAMFVRNVVRILRRKVSKLLIASRVEKPEILSVREKDRMINGSLSQKMNDVHLGEIQNSKIVSDAESLSSQEMPTQGFVKNVEKRTATKPGKSTCEENGQRNAPVYDLSVEGNHEFFANGILVHNSTKEGGCFTAGVLMAKDKAGKTWILDVVRGQWAAEEREAVIRQTAEIDGSKTVVYIEQEPGSGGKESAEGTIRNLAGFICIADRPSGDKVERADPFSVQVNNGNIYLKAGTEWLKDFIEEHRFFPFSKYKDQVDAASGAHAKLVVRKRLVGGLGSLDKNNILV
uniref:Putative structural protein n=1 Tax=viral metagenome TaxID=1070528 RepID=A0A6M3IXD6_9ZZZZ